ncbi:helix-turn-helix transcriptional regulator [Natranaerobius thermophilus]
MLKTIRKNCGLRQEEITGDYITRNLISLIENNRTPLNSDVASLVAENINKSLNYSLIHWVDTEDFYRPERYKVKEEVKDFINRKEQELLEGNLTLDEQELKSVENTLRKYRLTDKKAVLYELLSDFYNSSKQLNNEYMYLIRSKENYSFYPHHKDKLFAIKQRIIDNLINRDIEDSALKLIEIMYDTFESINGLNQRERNLLQYKKAWALYHQADYSSSIALINSILCNDSCTADDNELKANIENDFITTDCLLLLAKCYSATDALKKAKNIYYELWEKLSIENNTNKMLDIIINLINIEVRCNNKTNLFKLLNYSVTNESILKKQAQTKTLFKYYLELSQGWESIEDLDQAKDYYLAAIQVAISNNDQEELLEVSKKIFNFCEKRNQNYFLAKISPHLQEWIS